MPAWTPCVPKRAGSVTIGRSSSGIAGLSGPPVRAMPTPIITCAMPTVVATMYSGRSEVAIFGCRMK